MAAVVLPKTTFAITPAPTAVENAPQRILFVGQQLENQSTPDVLITNIGSAGEEDGLFGRRSMLATMIREFRKINTVSQIDAIPLNDAVASASAVGTIIFDGVSSQSTVLTVYVQSEFLYEFTITVSSGDSATVIASAVAAAINDNDSILVSASSLSGAVTLLATFEGLEGNNMSLRADESVSGVTVNVVKFSGGGANPTLPDLDSLLGDTRYQTVVWPASYDKDTIVNFLDARFNPTNAVLDGVAISSESESSTNLISEVSTLNSESYVLLGNKLIADAVNGPITTPVNSVSDDSNAAQFNFTPGPSVVIGSDVTLQNFTLSTSYNGSYVVSDSAVGNFNAAVQYVASESFTGSFSFPTDITGVTDVSNIAQFEYIDAVTMGGTQAVTISNFSTFTTYNGTFTVNDYAAGQFTAGVRFTGDEAGDFSFPTAVDSITDQSPQIRITYTGTRTIETGDTVTLSGFTTYPAYNGQYTVFAHGVGTFDVTQTFLGDDTTGTFEFDIPIDSVTNISNNAQFNYAIGDIFTMGEQVTIKNFVTNTSYNGTFTFATVGGTEFTAKVRNQGFETGGTFEFDTTIDSVAIGTNNEVEFTNSGVNTLPEGKQITIKDFVLNPTYNGTFVTLNATALTFGANIQFTQDDNTGNFVVFGTELVQNVGAALFEFNPSIAAQFAAIRSLRLTPDQNIAQYLVGGSITNAFGGPSRAATPYHNTGFDNLSVIKNNLGWSKFEQDDLNDNGVSFLGNNSSSNEVIAGDIVTTYLTNSQGSPDLTFKYLNYVDTASNVREYFWNNNRAQYAQTILTDGDLIPGVRSANAEAIEAFQSSLYSELSTLSPNGVIYGLTQAGTAAQEFFDQNLTVTLALSTGTVTITAKVPIVTQLRVINGTLQVVFDIDTRG